ncbi:putative phage abortive infection protein [Thiothrix nivea]|uniref:Uncharacterized protein n=1 Tax=Thiothrix nivea (strain ATCC 35100 / DSM 5205 / JP2) TaxID=870187 RepID=A0A656HN78_THINJ|nr:putative phage abortive infection protein [Thiothrix nivea]EIJ36986.1 hypothetical protein Thini_4515 [Thiothrix nivea DSM 5205]
MTNFTAIHHVCNAGENKTLKRILSLKLLELLEASRNDVYYVRRISSDEYSGRDAIHKIYKQFTQDFLHDTQLLNMPEPYATVLGDGKKYFRDDCKKVAGIKKRYGNFYLGKNGEDLGQYFRTLYNILKFIDNNKEIDNKKLYTNLLRAQLSRYELALLFYNCLSDFGEQKMAPLVKKYEILKHLEERTIPPENIGIWREFMHNECVDDGRGDSPRLLTAYSPPRPSHETLCNQYTPNIYIKSMYFKKR